MQDEASLVRRARQRDEEAWVRLYEDNFARIYRYVVLKIGERTEAEDITQQVFVNAIKAIGSYDYKGTPFSAWLYRIAVNKVKDFRRRQRFSSLFSFSEEGKEQDHPDMGPDSYDHLAGKQFWIRFNEFIGKLPRLQQEVFRLRFLDHLSIAEIALTLGKNESSVKTHLYRAIEKFKNEGFSLGSTPEEAL